LAKEKYESEEKKIKKNSEIKADALALNKLGEDEEKAPMKKKN